MLRRKSILTVSPWTALLLAAFAFFSTPILLFSLLLAAFVHECGHLLMLWAFRAPIESLRISAFGAELRVQNTPRLSYGREALAVLAGPVVNLMMAPLLAWGGGYWAPLYVFAGAQVVLGLFNLLPLPALDGGTLLWLLLAWLWEPFTADRWVRRTGITFLLLLALLGVWLFVESGSPFLLFASAGLAKKSL